MSDHPALDITDLSFRYPGHANRTVDIERLTLSRGEQILLTAGSGRGKSTLLSLIAGLLDPQRGRIVVAGTPIHELVGAARDRFRGRTIGMIFQTFNLLHGFSAAENVMAALLFSGVPRHEHRSRSQALLGALGIDRPDADVDRLSVGQQQRVAVARAVACSPALVLADEPTASLDPENSEAAMDLIQQACRDIHAALLCVSHDPSMASRFSRRQALAELAAGPETAAVGGAG